MVWGQWGSVHVTLVFSCGLQTRNGNIDKKHFYQQVKIWALNFWTRSSGEFINTLELILKSRTAKHLHVDVSGKYGWIFEQICWIFEQIWMDMQIEFGLWDRNPVWSSARRVKRWKYKVCFWNSDFESGSVQCLEYFPGKFFFSVYHHHYQPTRES